MTRPRHPAWWLSAVLLAVNAVIVTPLFRTEYVSQTGTPEGVFVSYARYARDHWPDLNWFRFWYAGIPFQNAYPPGLHVTVAAVSGFANISAAWAFHVVEALMYALGPVTLFWMALRLTRSVSWSFYVGLLYSLISPSAFLVPEIRRDLGSLWGAQRLHTPIAYGDTPLMVSLTLIPLAILALDAAVEKRRPIYYLAAAIGLAAVPLTNWPGAIVCAFAVVAYGLASGRKSWMTAAIAGVLGYAFVMPWLPLSAVMATVRGTEAFLAINRFAPRHLLYAVILAFCTWLILRIIRREPGYLGFFLLFFFYMAALALGFYWFGATLLAQPQRFHLAMEMGCILSVVFLIRPLAARWRWVGRPVAAAFAILCAIQFFQYCSYARDLIRPIEITRTSEYKTAHWFDAHMPDSRVMVSGSETFWLNAFTDTPQLAGCCPQGLLTQTIPVANYGINTDLTAEDRAFENTLLWFKALGVRAVAVSGPGSTEVYRPFYHPGKFEGRLPVLWREGGDVIYGVPWAHYSLAHAMHSADLVQRSPAHGVDTAGLVPYVAAIEQMGAPELQVRWKDNATMEITGDLHANQVVSVQETAHPGWHATVNGSARAVFADKLGFLVVAANCEGRCSIRLYYDGGTEMAVARWIRLAAILGSILWALFDLFA